MFDHWHCVAHRLGSRAIPGKNMSCSLFVCAPDEEKAHTAACVKCNAHVCGKCVDALIFNAMAVKEIKCPICRTPYRGQIVPVLSDDAINRYISMFEHEAWFYWMTEAISNYLLPSSASVTEVHWGKIAVTFLVGFVAGQLNS